VVDTEEAPVAGRQLLLLLGEVLLVGKVLLVVAVGKGSAGQE
jgi:hypothetical protein